MAFVGRLGITRSIVPTVARLGAALVHAMRPSVVAKRGSARALRFVVGRDTRESGAWIEEELARGAGSEGATVTSAGVIPTPAIAYVTPAMAFDAGIVISASHNPFEDNGIKVFSGKGEKFTETLEREVEAIMAGAIGRCRRHAAARFDRTNVIDEYIAHTRARVSRSAAASRVRSWRSTRANGATTTVAPRLFKDWASTLVIVERQAGRTQHQSRLRLDASRGAVARGASSSGCRMGVAFDGDGDRAIFVDATGTHRRRRRGAADVRAAPQGEGPAEGQRHRRDRDEQHRPRDRACARAASRWCAAPSATST